MTRPEPSTKADAGASTYRPRVLFLCTGNACRSQLAEGWLRHLAGDRFEALSAGTEPHGLNPRAVATMAELGIDIAGHRSEHLSLHLPPAAATPDLVIAVCDQAAQNCPTVPGAVVLRWPFPDPAPGGVDVGADEATTQAAFAAVRDAIRARIAAWLAAGAPLDGSDPTATDRGPCA
ncbi:MAG: arsenate reductase ArsC [Planctomycetota bacterium]|nr:arsenate reductase ArsC [Planctomycetota bacterium]